MRSDLSRRTFMASATSIAASFALSEALVAEAAAGKEGAQAVSAAVPFRFDRAAFAAVLDRPYVHRQLCAPSSYAEATVAMSHFSNSIAAYADPDGFAAGSNSLHCIAVLYNGGSPRMVFDDAMFAKYPIGLMDDEEMRPNDLRYRALWKGMKTNPMGEFLRSLADQGVSFFVCNNGLSSIAYEIAKRIAPSDVGVTREQVVAIHDDLADHFMPGTMLVPSGAAAVNAAQEAKFTFLP